MFEGLLALIDQVNDLALGGFIVFLRVGAALALIPGFGERTISIRVRIVIAFALSVTILPLVHTQLPGLKTGFLPILFATETIIGLAVGVFFRLFLFVLQIAGTLAAQATSLSQIFGGGNTPEPLPAFGNLMVVAGMALAMASGLHVKTVLALADTYTVLPAGHFPATADLTDWGVSGISRAFARAFSLVAPFLILSVIYNVALGAINRAMPQLMVAFIGAPAITLGGLALLAASLPVILPLWLAWFDAGLSNPFGAHW
jgi:flagellar biosynthetic protein FliR